MPGVDIAQTRAFSKVWDSGGIKILFDEAALRMATDWSNIVLRSYIEQQMKAVVATQKAAQEKAGVVKDTTTATDAVSKQTVPSPPRKSSIILTDGD